MENLLDAILNMFKSDEIRKVVISKPSAKSLEYKKISAEKKGTYYQIAKFTETQVFHENVGEGEVAERVYQLLASGFKQLNAWSDRFEHMILLSKKGQSTFKKKALKEQTPVSIDAKHNREKNYLIKEGKPVEPLVDMGVLTPDGRIVKAMYDKYKQINRFLEIIDDEVVAFQGKDIKIIDFGCGKSYLTFILYYYLTEIRKIPATIIGLDLKADVIEKCNAAARKYGYTGLRFEVGDISQFEASLPVDMVITLHACDTATDFALYNAIKWDAEMIFSVPCCQHELNKQIHTDNLSLFTRYGIIKERFSALATDAIRANLLEYAGYKTQLLEFVDFAHTPKNILIRAVKRKSTSDSVREKALQEVEDVMREFNFNPTLYSLVVGGETLKGLVDGNCCVRAPHEKD